MLAGEPWFMPREEILKLDDFYINRILFHPRDKNGVIIPKEIPEEMGHEEAFRHTWRRRGFTESTIDRLWKEKIAKEQKPANQNGDALRAELTRRR